MTTLNKAITAIVFSLMTILAALILSFSTGAIDANAQPMQVKHSSAPVLTDAPTFTLGATDTVYYHSLACNTCPVSLPPTSGQVDTLESFGIILTDAINSLLSGLSSGLFN